MSLCRLVIISVLLSVPAWSAEFTVQPLRDASGAVTGYLS